MHKPNALNRRVALVTGLATLALGCSPTTPGTGSTDPSWVPDASTLTTIAGTDCTVGTRYFYSHMNVRDLPRKFAPGSDPFVSALENGSTASGKTNPNQPGRTSSDLRFYYNNESYAESTTGYGIPIDVKTVDKPIRVLPTFALASSANPALQNELGWKVSQGQAVKVDGTGSTSEVALYEGSTSQGTSFPHPTDIRYQGYPVSPRWDSFNITVFPTTAGRCTVYESIGLKHGVADPGHLDAPFGKSAQMTWDTAAMQQTPAQTRGADSPDPQLVADPLDPTHQYRKPLGATAARVPLIAGVVRIAEALGSKPIDHVLQLFSRGCSNEMIWPARATDCTWDPTAAPYGTVFRLPLTWPDGRNFTPESLNITDPVAKKIFEALQTHGAMLLSSGDMATGVILEAPERDDNNCIANGAQVSSTTATCWGSNTISDLETSQLVSHLETVDTSAVGACRTSTRVGTGKGSMLLSDDLQWFRMCG